MAVFESVASILMMIGIGVFMAWKLDFRETNSAGMVSLVTNITLPAYMISNICMNYDRATLIAMAPGLVVPFVSISLCCTLGFAVAWLISVPRQRRGTFCSMFSLSNTIFIGLPVNTMLFGPDSIPFVLLFYIGNTTLFWTIGTYFINLDGDRPAQRILSAANLKRIFSPPLYMFLFAVVLVLLELRPPLMILNLCKTVGSMTTPLSMIFIGITLYAVNWRAIRPDLTMGALLVARFVIAPLIVVGFCRVLPMPLLMKKVFVIQAGMPIMTLTAVIAKACGADHHFAAVQTSVSTVVCLATIPAWMIVMSHFNIFG